MNKALGFVGLTAVVTVTGVVSYKIGKVVGMIKAYGDWTKSILKECEREREEERNTMYENRAY